MGSKYLLYGGLLASVSIQVPSLSHTSKTVGTRFPRTFSIRTLRYVQQRCLTFLPSVIERSCGHLIISYVFEIIIIGGFGSKGLSHVLGDSYGITIISV